MESSAMPGNDGKTANREYQNWAILKHAQTGSALIPLPFHAPHV
jgi:hypothetical protein